jgi:hypothetical protein
LRNNEGRIKNILKKKKFIIIIAIIVIIALCFKFVLIFSQILEIRYYPMVTIPKITVTKLSPTIVEPILLLH